MSTRGLTGFIFAGLLICSAAHAQAWLTYTYPNLGFAIGFPSAPSVQTTTTKSAAGLTLPVTRYVVRQDGAEYILSVVDYSGTNADALGAIGETARSFIAKGKVNADSGARVNGTHGRELTITEGDGSRSDVAIFFFDNHLYTAVGRALPPNPLERSADTTRFQRSLQFPVEDSGGFLGLFGRRSGADSHAAASTAANGRTEANAASDDRIGAAVTGAAGSSATGHSDVAIGRADAACAGKSAGDVVQLDTPAGPVPATCTLTARPNAPPTR